MSLSLPDSRILFTALIVQTRVESSLTISTINCSEALVKKATQLGWNKHFHRIRNASGKFHRQRCSITAHASREYAVAFVVPASSAPHYVKAWCRNETSHRKPVDEIITQRRTIPLGRFNAVERRTLPSRPFFIRASITHALLSMDRSTISGEL